MTEREPPVRLLDDPSTDPALKNALGELSVETPGFDSAAGLERLQSALNAPQPPPGGPAEASGTAFGVGVAVGVVALVGIGAILLSAGELTPGLKGSSSSALPAVSIAPALPTVPAASAQLPLDPPAAASAVVTPSSSGEVKVSAPSAVSAARPSKEQRRRDEIAHLAGVRRQVSSNCAAAVRAVDRGHQRFRGGFFYQERESLAIVCLARSGSPSAAKARGRRFLDVFPASPFAAQVRGAIGE